MSDRIALPVDGRVFMQDSGLDDLLLRILIDLVVDDTVATVVRVRLVQGVAINAIRLNHVVCLIAHFHLLALAQINLNRILRGFVNRQVEAIDTVGVVCYCLVTILVHLRLTDSVLQVSVLMLNRTIHPVIWSFGFADRYRVAI